MRDERQWSCVSQLTRVSGKQLILGANSICRLVQVGYLCYCSITPGFFMFKRKASHCRLFMNIIKSHSLITVNNEYSIHRKKKTIWYICECGEKNREVFFFTLFFNFIKNRINRITFKKLAFFFNLELNLRKVNTKK